MATLPFAQPYLGSASRWQLDLDDLESRTHERIAALARENRDEWLADREQEEAGRCAQTEDDVLRGADRVYVCSERDRRALAGRGRAAVAVLPNVVPIQGPLPPPPPAGPFTFLFIGTLGYYPNFDAVRWWCSAVLPRLRLSTAAPFRVLVVGGGAPPELLDIAGEPEVEIVGEVPDVTSEYERAHAVIVPVRAGGGPH